MDHIFLHCGKTIILWALVFSLFRVYWVIYSIVRETFFEWHGSFVGRKRREVWRATLFAFHGIYGKKEIEDPVRTHEFSTQRLKLLFLCSLFY